MKKHIIVKSESIIYALGGVRGPVEVSKCDTSIIFRILNETPRVVEILKDGTEMELDYNNFDIDLNEEFGLNETPVVQNVEVSETLNDVIEEQVNATIAVKTSVLDVCEED